SPTPGSAGSDSGTVTVSRSAVLSISKVHSGNGTVGQDLPFTLRVHNAGPSVADQVVITDPLPAGLTYQSATGTGWTCTADPAGTVSCQLAGSIPVGGDSADLVLSVNVGAAAYPSVTNTAQASSSDPDLPGTASTSDQLTVNPAAQLRLTKQHVGTFVVGRAGSYRLTVSNTGPTATPGPVSIVDVLPPGLSYRSVAGTGWSCSATAGTVHCSRPGPLAAGESSQLTLTVDVTAPAYPSVTNSATASAPGSPDASGVDTAPVTPLAVLSISKRLASYQDNLATYQITVHNAGPNATNQSITVTDKLPAGLAFRSAGGTGWSCGTSGGTVTCLHPTSLAVGASTVLSLVTTVTAAPGTSISNTATVSGGAPSGQSSASQSAVLAVTATGSGTGSGAGLPNTGRNTETPAGLALGLLLAGLGLLLLARRPRRAC
ncbi:MAG TPA: DUF11 domain-containing protein, partial [Jatrophihabitans sp.]|nr:DUF11 domain-containing protein [Jatrophihabitans sp.]